MLSNEDIEQFDTKTSEITKQQAEKTALNVYSDLLPYDLSKHVVNTTHGNVSASQETMLGDSMIISNAKQQIVSETSKVVSVQKTSVRQQMHSTSQKTVSVSSSQSAASVITGEVHTSNTAVAKAENMTADRKESKNQKAKGSDKSEDKKEGEMPKPERSVTAEENVKSSKTQSESKKTTDNTAPKLNTNLPNQSSKTDNVNSDKNVKESKSPQCENKKKNDESPTKSQEKVSDQPVQTDKAAANANGKTGKQNQKVKKNNKQDKQVETKMSHESEKQSVSQESKVETTRVRVISESKELKLGIKKVTASPAPVSALAASEIITDSQLETPIPTKRKKKSKRSKGGSPPSQSKDVCTESKVEAKETKTVTTHQTQDTIAVAQVHKSLKEEHMQVMREVIATDHQSSQKLKGIQKDAKSSEKNKEVTLLQQSVEEPQKESRNVPITVTGESEQTQLAKSTTGRTDGESQRREVQVLISHMTELQRKNDSKSLKTLLSALPDWLISPQRKCELEGSVVESDAHTNKEILSHVRKLAEAKLTHLEDDETMEKHEFESVSEKAISSGATPRISKISIGSAKLENQITKKTSQVWREEVSQFKSVDLRAPSPLLRMRSPSPTFITIESTRKTDSPQRVTPSPTLLHRPPTPPTPPPRRCDTPTSRLNRITPSPTFDRAENLARLKDTTAKLSRGVTPPPLLSPQQISEKKSEIVEPPASFHRQIKIESQIVEAQTLTANETQSESETQAPLCPYDADLEEDSELLSASVKQKREFFEDAQKAEIKKTYVRKEPIAILERLGPDMEEDVAENKNKEIDELPRADLSGLVNKFESSEEKMYFKKELIPLAEQLHNKTEGTACNKEKVDILEQGMPSFDIQAIKNVFELGELSSSFREEREDQEEPESNLSETTADTSKRERPQETRGGSRQSTPLPLQKHEAEAVPAEPSAFSEAKSITEHFSNVDEFGNEVIGKRTAIIELSESSSTQQVPFSYADVVRRQAAAARRTETYDEDATEKLLRNFHKTWTESETVFKSLGYSVSEETTAQVLSSETRIVSSGKTLNSMTPQNWMAWTTGGFNLSGFVCAVLQKQNYQVCIYI